MATSEGNNPVTGSAHASEDQAKENAAKAAKAAAKAEQSEAGKLDKRLQSTLKAAEGSLSKLSEAIAAAKDGNVHKHVVDAEGNPFKTWQAYLTNRLSSQPLMHKVVRNAVIKELYENGVSLRAAAKATGVSVGTAHGAVNDTDGKRQAKPGGDTAGVASTPAQNAAKAVTQLQNACAKAKDRVSDMSEDELRAVIQAGREAANVAAGVLKLRGMAAEQRAKDAANPKAEVKISAHPPKPGPRVAASA